MVEWEDMEFASLHKYIKNTSTCETVLTEHLLNSSRKPQTPRRARKIPMQLGRKKVRKKKKEGMGWDQHPWQGTEGEERLLHSEQPIHRGESSWGRKGLLGNCRKRQPSVCGRQDKARTALMVSMSVLLPCARQPKFVSPGAERG